MCEKCEKLKAANKKLRQDCKIISRDYDEMACVANSVIYELRTTVEKQAAELAALRPAAPENLT